MTISQDRQDFIELYFNEAEEPDKEIFDTLKTPEELHYLADHWDWEDGVDVLQWIVESPLCSEATALMIFWQAQPNDFTEYSWKAKKLPDGDIEMFNLIRTIVDKFECGFYAKTSITYDPICDMPDEIIIPEIMYQATTGEETYFYYDEKEIRSWFGEYLDNKIARCDTALDLFNIAAFLRYSNIENYEKILKHPLCDKGVALLIFWRLHTYCNMYCNEELPKEIIEKMQTNQYQEVLYYDPNKDTEISINKKQKWTIPAKLKCKIN
jgi:hypothetical protein